MGETRAHMELVNRCADWINKRYVGGDSNCILIERPDFPNGKRPFNINGYIPDIMAIRTPEYELILGEAKTANDIDNQHTTDQITAFLTKCNEYRNSLFVVAVPWYRIGLAKSVVDYCCRLSNIKNVNIEYLEKLP